MPSQTVMRAAMTSSPDVHAASESLAQWMASAPNVEAASTAVVILSATLVARCQKMAALMHLLLEEDDHLPIA